MQFYAACVRVAEQIEDILSNEQREIFIETEFKDLFLYHFSLGLWIRNHCLKKGDYLYRALQTIGYRDTDSMSMFLLEFIQQYAVLLLSLSVISNISLCAFSAICNPYSILLSQPFCQ